MGPHLISSSHPLISQGGTNGIRTLDPSLLLLLLFLSIQPSHSSPAPSSTTIITTTTTLRPLAERQCRIRYCIHGYCDSAAGRCKCDPGWRGYFCDQACSKNCGQNGQCIFFNGTQVCNCLLPWTGEFCTEQIPPRHSPDQGEQDRSLVYWLGGSFAVGVVVLVVVGALFMFCLWRKRLAFALRVVYYFLPYEDNDGRIYDALVSYLSDEHFVHCNLRPKLEDEMGFTLCQRDFPVGGPITDNILDGLENSRRFILIITPAYLRKEWTDLKAQQALHEMLKRKFNIIPILLEDISTYPEDSLNPTLKTILESVTPLKYPGSTAEEQKLLKFWKQVKLCMPKRKKVAESDRTALALHGDATAEIPDDLVRSGSVV